MTMLRVIQAMSLEYDEETSTAHIEFEPYMSVSREPMDVYGTVEHVWHNEKKGTVTYLIKGMLFDYQVTVPAVEVGP